MHIPNHPILGPTVWNADSWRNLDYRYELQPRDLLELERIRDQSRAAGKTVNEVSPNDFHTKPLADLGEHLRATLMNGPGFLLISNWNTHTWSESDSKLLLWGIGTLLGKPRTQNLLGDRISTVAKVSDPTLQKHSVGISTGNEEASLHTENARPPFPPRLISLLCLSQAPEGGESLLASGHYLYNLLLSHNPDILERLHQDFPFGRHSEAHPDGKLIDVAPIFTWNGDDLAVRYNRYWIELAEQTTGITLDPKGREALEVVTDIMNSKDFPLTMLLKPGELVVVNNRTVLHGRKKFRDNEYTTKRRLLLRLWLD